MYTIYKLWRAWLLKVVLYLRTAEPKKLKLVLVSFRAMLI